MKFLAEKIIKKLTNKKLTISVAESCTGGLLSSALTSIDGSSRVFKFGVVVYSNKSKIKILYTSKKIIKKYGATSKQVCLSMIKNLGRIVKTNISLSVTGIAGPSGGTKKKPVGLVYVGIKKDNKIQVKKYLFKNKGRAYIQKTTVSKSLGLILNSLK